MNKNVQAAMQLDVAATHGINGDFSEEIIYTPRDGGAPRRITGIVEREGDEAQEGLTHGRAMRLVIRVENHATRGILASEIDTGDALKLKVNGVDDETRKVSTRDSGGKPLVTWDSAEIVITLV